MTAHNLDASEVVKALNSHQFNGLTESQVSDLRAKYGENKLREKKKKTNFQRFIDQFKDVMILILIAASAVSFAIALSEGDPEGFFEPILVLVIVVVNAIMGTVQEGNAEKALDQLPKLRDCEAHCSVIYSSVDEKTMKKLGVRITCEPEYEVEKLNHV